MAKLRPFNLFLRPLDILTIWKNNCIFKYILICLKMTLFPLCKLKKRPKKNFCSQNMIAKTNDAARWKNSLSNMDMALKKRVCPSLLYVTFGLFLTICNKDWIRESLKIQNLLNCLSAVANLLQLGVARSPEAWEKVRQLEKNCNVQKYQTSN